MSDRYLVIGGYHDGERYSCNHPEMRLSEHEPTYSFKKGELGANSNDLAPAMHCYQRHEFNFRFPNGLDMNSICVWAPMNQDIRETMIKLLKGYKKGQK